MNESYEIEKEALLVERARIRKLLLGVGHPHEDDQYDFDASSEETDLEFPDESDRASEIEDFSSRVILEGELEKRLLEVKDALHALDIGTYGKCMICDVVIPKERLSANPAALTCILHANVGRERSSQL